MRDGWSNDALKDRVARDGFAVVGAVIGPELVERLVSSISSNLSHASGSTARGSFARRNLLDVPPVRELADSAPLRSIVEPILGAQARPVRGLLFDKTRDANWVVPWHQDLSIAVNRRMDVPGFGPWSRKAGVVHVQPPVEILKRMLTIRLHLDDCDEANGPLQVIPSTHDGVLSPQAIERFTQTGARTLCTAWAGDAVVMRPLLLHASFPAKRASHRRVVHLEYASAELPQGLEWHERQDSGSALA